MRVSQNGNLVVEEGQFEDLLELAKSAKAYAHEASMNPSMDLQNFGEFINGCQINQEIIEVLDPIVNPPEEDGEDGANDADTGQDGG